MNTTDKRNALVADYAAETAELAAKIAAHITEAETAARRSTLAARRLSRAKRPTAAMRERVAAEVAEANAATLAHIKEAARLSDLDILRATVAPVAHRVAAERGCPADLALDAAIVETLNREWSLRGKAGAALFVARVQVWRRYGGPAEVVREIEAAQ